MKGVLLIIISIVISSLGQISLKYGALKANAAEQSGGFQFMHLWNVPNLVGLLLYGVSAFLWMIVLKKVELSIAYPMVSLGYVFVFVASYFLFQESISLTRLLGLLIVVVGIVVISRS